MLPDKYHITQFDDDEIFPEETLVDSMSDHSSVEVPITDTVFKIFYGLIVLILLIFVARAFDLQIREGQSYAALADQGRLYRYNVPALRGIIFDRHGVPLVDNVPAFDVVMVTNELRDELNQDIRTIANILQRPAEDIQTSIENNQDRATFTLQTDIDKQVAIELQTLQIPGVHIVSYAKRDYIYDEAMSHILGYTSRVSSEELVISSEYISTDRVGRLGLEASYESWLKGKRRTFDLQTDEYTDAITYEPGHDIHTTIDAAMQEQLYKDMRTVLLLNGLRKAGAVVQNVKTGEVLAMASFPNFDPNIFENTADPDVADDLDIVLNSKNQPLFNRVVSGLYSPGSTIKPFFALIGLQEGAVTPSTIIHSPGYIEVPSEIDASVVYRYNDWKVHGWSDIRKAIADSVDVYFYALGGGYDNIDGVGINTLSKELKSVRADKKLDVDLPLEAVGIVPNDKWKKENKGEPWYVGDTYNVSIGQGDLLVTPLWINAQLAAIANGGNLMRPYIVQEIQDRQSTIESFESKVLDVMEFDFTDMEVVRSGMRQTITDGTARRLNDLPVAVAGKTGTAQVSGERLNSLFTVFGPYDEPEIAMTVIIEDIDDDQNLAVQVASQYLSWYFSTQ